MFWSAYNRLIPDNIYMMSNSAEWSAVKNKAIAKIESAAEDLNQISQELWNKPELGYNEHHAHKVQ